MKSQTKNVRYPRQSRSAHQGKNLFEIIAQNLFSIILLVFGFIAAGFVMVNGVGNHPVFAGVLIYCGVMFSIAIMEVDLS